MLSASRNHNTNAANFIPYVLKNFRETRAIIKMVLNRHQKLLLNPYFQKIATVTVQRNLYYDFLLVPKLCVLNVVTQYRQCTKEFYNQGRTTGFLAGKQYECVQTHEYLYSPIRFHGSEFHSIER
jgi:hypothetical protein